MDTRESMVAAVVLLVALVLVGLAAPERARADEPWMLSIDGAAAIPLTTPQSAWFEPGGSVGATLWRSLAGPIAVGARARGVLLADGAAPADPTLADPGVGGLATLGVGARLRLEPAWDDGPRRTTGPWLDAFGAVALTGDVARPALEIGLGYGFAIDDVTVGPSVRWVTVFETGSQLEPGHANMLLIGVELTLFDARPASPPAPTFAARPEPAIDFCPDEPEDVDGVQDDDGCPDHDDDEDEILDGDDACPLAREVVNGVEDQDGCPDRGLIELVDDRVVLEERVLFDYQRARVRHRARPVLRAIVELYRQHPEWTELRVEGHADVRGTRAFNQQLSERRAAEVRRVLVRFGIPDGIITSVGHGERRPRASGDDEVAHERNRRVEFVVVRREARPVTRGAR